MPARGPETPAAMAVGRQDPGDGRGLGGRQPADILEALLTRPTPAAAANTDAQPPSLPAQTTTRFAIDHRGASMQRHGPDDAVRASHAGAGRTRCTKVR